MIGRRLVVARNYGALQGASLALALRLPPYDTRLYRSCKPQIKLANAAAAGLPVVAGAVGGLLDLIAADRTGILVPPGDVGRFAQALDALAADPARAETIGALAREHVLAHYSFERMVDAFEHLYVAARPAARTLPTARAETAEI